MSNHVKKSINLQPIQASQQKSNPKHKQQKTQRKTAQKHSVTEDCIYTKPLHTPCLRLHRHGTQATKQTEALKRSLKTGQLQLQSLTLPLKHSFIKGLSTTGKQ